MGGDLGAAIDAGIKTITAVTGATATYVYCLVQSPQPPALAGAPPGLPGTGPPRLLALATQETSGGLWAVVADASLPDYGGETIDARLSDLSWVSDRALAHERMVEHFAAAGTVLPMKLFTLFTGDERALARLGEQRDGIERALARIAGRVEWGVRILFHEARARQEAVAAVASAGETAGGRGFLLRKKAQQDGARERTAKARAEAERAFADLSALAAAARRREPAATATDGGRLLLDAAFLVPVAEGGAFEAAVERCAGELAASACEVTLTGPWPPYNFVGDPA